MAVNVLSYTYIACLVFFTTQATATLDHTHSLILEITEVSHLELKRTERGANYCPSLVPKMKYTFTKTPNLTLGCSDQPFPRNIVIYSVNNTTIYNGNPYKKFGQFLILITNIYCCIVD